MAKKRVGFGDFFCTVCGERIEKNAQTCPKCANPYSEEKYNGAPVLGAGGVGWSDRADDATFRKNNKKNLKASLIGMVVVSLIIALALIFSGQVDLADGGGRLLAVIMAALWGFWLIWLILHFRKKKDWEGVVESRDSRTQESVRRDSDGRRYTETRTIFTTRFRDSGGKKHVLTESDRSSWYDYLAEGDRVRYHGNHMNYYEKYDKSRDSVLPCASCGLLRDPRETYCGKCGAILLKGAPAPTPAAAPQAPAGQARFCPNCGAQAIGPFCTECGVKLN